MTASISDGIPNAGKAKKAAKRKKEAIIPGRQKKSKGIKIKVGVDDIDPKTETYSVGDLRNPLKGKKKSTVSGRKKRSKECKIEDVDEVPQISQVDEDCSKGMKKWLNDYQKSRPGLKILQQRIDEFITNHEAQEENARKEREAQAAEGGWTVVTHQKGRKKTTDSESGIAVGSVAQAAVMENVAKKKNKGIPLDFYRFQKREARRSEIMMLQSKFEQEKKHIQQLRAARKFRPY